MKKIPLILLLVLSILMAVPGVVFADQEGNNNWCNIDSYGCWVTNEDGGKDYLMFWSESARQYFMGDSTPPYTNVVDYSSYIGIDKMSMNQMPDDGSAEWKNALAEVYRKYEGFLYTSQWASSQITAMTKIIEKNLEEGRWQDKNVWSYIESIEAKYAKLAEKAGKTE